MATAHFTLRQLEIFAAVVRTGQVRRAADALHLSQAAVSQALRELAIAFDLTLFERQGREIVATAAARQLLHLSAAPVAALRGMPEQLSPGSTSSALIGQIRVAASSTITRYILPRPLAILRDAQPGLEITVVSGNSANVETRVADMDADIGFIEGPAQRNDIDATHWGTDILQIIAPPDYPTADISLETLAEHAWVARESGSGTRAVFEQSLALAGIAPPRAGLIVDDSGAMVRAVAAGAGLACVSRRAATQASALARVQFVDLPGLSLQRPLWRVGRYGAALAPIVERFMAALAQTMPADID